MPKKIIKKVEGLCRDFLWRGSEGGAKKPAVAWADVCKDVQYGGLGIKYFVSWNQVAILKQLWTLKHSKECLWVRWVHAYYIRGRDMMQCSVPLDISWMLRKIMSMRQLVQQWGSWERVQKCHKFTFDKAYELMSQVQAMVP